MELLVATLAHSAPGRDADGLARIRLISDGDLSAGISAAVAGTNIHALIGIGGAPEGVITAAAMKCLNGEIQARLVFDAERLGVDKDKVPPEKEVRR